MKQERKRKKKWTAGGIYALCASLLFTGFTAYTLLDTFVIPRSYAVVAQAEESDDTAAETASHGTGSRVASGNAGSGVGLGAAVADAQTEEEESTAQASAGNAEVFTGETVVTDSSYSDENIAVTLSEYRVNDTTVYVADVWVSSPEYLQTAFAKGTYGKNVKAATSDTAEDVNAILAINGDFYGARTTGYVIRDGVLYRNVSSGSEDLVIWADGSFSVVDEDDVTAEELLADGAVEVFSFGPGLVMDGQIAVTEDEEVGKAMADNPRTAIGILGENHYVFVVSDGRTDESEGLTLYELAEFMQSLGVETAYNLDGGGSSTMVFNGQLINNPTTSGRSVKERSVSDIVYIGY